MAGKSLYGRGLWFQRGSWNEFPAKKEFGVQVNVVQVFLVFALGSNQQRSPPFRRLTPARIQRCAAPISLQVASCRRERRTYRSNDETRDAIRKQYRCLSGRASAPPSGRLAWRMKRSRMAGLFADLNEFAAEK